MDTITLPQTPPSPNANDFSHHLGSALFISHTVSPAALVDQILSLIADSSRFRWHGLSDDRDTVRMVRKDDYFTLCREFPGVSKAVYTMMMDQLQELRNTTIDFPKTLRIDYFAAESLLIIILPGTLHRIIALETQLFLRKTLFQQGFYWLSSNDNMGNNRWTAVDFTVSAREHYKPSFHLDGSLEIAENDTTFMAIEVVDGQSYRYGRRKASALMKGSNGKIRFVVLIDLTRGISEGSGQQNNRSNVLLPDDGSGSTNQSPIFRGSNPALRRSSRKRSRGEGITVSSPLGAVEPGTTADPTNNESLPDVTYPQMAYTRATVTVFSSYIRPHATLPGIWEGIITTPVNAVEYWPAAPAPEPKVSFTWDETSVLAYPAAMKGKMFTMEWGWLHALFQNLFEKPDGRRGTVSRPLGNRENVVDDNDEGREMELDFDNP